MAKLGKESIENGEKSHETVRQPLNTQVYFVGIWCTIIGLIQTNIPERIKNKIAEGCNSIKTWLSWPSITSNELATPNIPTEERRIISQESRPLNRSWREERNEDIAPTLPTSDFPNSLSRCLRNQSFSPNPPEVKGPKYATAEEILSEEQLNSFRHFRNSGCSKEEITEYARRELGERFKGWIYLDDIKKNAEMLKGLPSGCYLIAISGEHMNHCTALYITDDHRLEYFDSMGKPLHPDNPETSNSIQFQDKNYNTCGLHAVFSLRQRDNLGSMERVQGSYPSTKLHSLFINDRYVINEIHIKHKFQTGKESTAYTALKSVED